MHQEEITYQATITTTINLPFYSKYGQCLEKILKDEKNNKYIKITLSDQDLVKDLVITVLPKFDIYNAEKFINVQETLKEEFETALANFKEKYNFEI